MAVPVIASSSLAQVRGVDTTTTISSTAPSGVQAGDLLICLAVCDNLAGTAQFDDTTNKPTGFTLIKQVSLAGGVDCCLAAFYRVATGGESWPIAWKHAGMNLNQDLAAWMLRITGADTTNPINATGTEASDATVSTDLVIPALTTDVADCLGIYLMVSDGSDTAPYSVAGTGWTEQAEVEQPADDAAGVGGVYGTKSITSAGSSGTATVTQTVNDGAIGFQIAIAPTSGASLQAVRDFVLQLSTP